MARVIGEEQVAHVASLSHYFWILGEVTTAATKGVGANPKTQDSVGTMLRKAASSFALSVLRRRLQ